MNYCPCFQLSGNIFYKVMCSAAPSFPSIKQANNYERLCRLLVDVGWQVLRETFDRVRPPGSLHSVLADSQIHALLDSLEKKRVLSTPQWSKLYPVIKSSVSSATFDSTLLLILLRNICGLVPPATGWSNCPLVTDTTLEADIARIKFYRNEVYTHASNASVEDAAFNYYWKKIKDTLVRLGGACYEGAIDDFENEIMDPEFEGHYQELLKQWVEDDYRIEDKLEDNSFKKQRKLDDESSEDSERSTRIDDANGSETPAMATVYSNRATAYYCLGNFHQALNDARTAVKLKPTMIKAIQTGARACMQLQCYDDAISWCEKGLAIDGTSKTLLDLQARCVADRIKLQATKSNPEMHSVEGKKTTNSLLKTTEDVEDNTEEGPWHSNVYNTLGDFKNAIEYHERHLKIAKEVGDRASEGKTYGKLGNACAGLGDFKKAMENYEHQLKIAKEVGNWDDEGNSYGNLGNAYNSLGNFKKAIEYHELHLKIAKEVGDRASEGKSYGYLCNAYVGLGDFKKAMENYEHQLRIAKEVGNRDDEGSSYVNLGNAYHSLGDFSKAIAYHERHLKIAKEVGNKSGEGISYGNLGNDYNSLGNFKKAIEYHELHLKIAKEVGDRASEGKSYGYLGNAYVGLGDFKKAMENYEHQLRIAKEVGNRDDEGSSYGNLGNAYNSLGNFKKAIEYHELHLKIAKEVGDRASEGNSYGNLGNTYYRLGDFQKAIEYHERHLKVAKEVGDRAGEGMSYGNLGKAYYSLGDFKQAIEYHERHLQIAKEVGDKSGEGISYGNLGNAYHGLGGFKKAIEYHGHGLQIAKEVGDSAEEGRCYFNLGICFEYQGCLMRALDCFHSSVRLFSDVRKLLHGKDERKISYRNLYDLAKTRLWHVTLKQGDVVEALFAVEQGRAQALIDLMNLNYKTETPDLTDKMTFDTLSCLPMNTVVMAVHEREVIFWIIQNGKNIQLRRKEISHSDLEDSATALLQSLTQNVHDDIAVSDLKCEDRSLDRMIKVELSKKKGCQTISQRTIFDTNPLRAWYDITISPIKDLINGDELTFVPEGPLCLAPYAAFMDSDSKYLGESFRIRLIPSLSSLKLIEDCSPDYHQKSGALLVGDPCLDEVRDCGLELEQLPLAKKEVEMIGKILNVVPLIGKMVTKHEVLRRLSSVALVHIAAHGSMETGEIALAANPTRASQIPIEEDFLLRMSDVMRVQMRAKLVVLSCCHGGGEITAEGVVGIARAFLGAGARSVLVSLWAIDDEATLEFMKSFYLHLAEGVSASGSLNRAMKCLRESNKFSEVKYWAPFVLIGDDVTLDFAKGD